MNIEWIIQSVSLFSPLRTGRNVTRANTAACAVGREYFETVSKKQAWDSAAAMSAYQGNKLRDTREVKIRDASSKSLQRMSWKFMTQSRSNLSFVGFCNASRNVHKNQLDVSRLRSVNTLIAACQTVNYKHVRQWKAMLRTTLLSSGNMRVSTLVKFKPIYTDRHETRHCWLSRQYLNTCQVWLNTVR